MLTNSIINNHNLNLVADYVEHNVGEIIHTKSYIDDLGTVIKAIQLTPSSDTQVADMLAKAGYHTKITDDTICNRLMYDGIHATGVDNILGFIVKSVYIPMWSYVVLFVYTSPYTTGAYTTVSTYLADEFFSMFVYTGEDPYICKRIQTHRQWVYSINLANNDYAEILRTTNILKAFAIEGTHPYLLLDTGAMLMVDSNAELMKRLRRTLDYGTKVTGYIFNPDGSICELADGDKLIVAGTGMCWICKGENYSLYAKNIVVEES